MNSGLRNHLNHIGSRQTNNPVRAAVGTGLLTAAAAFGALCCVAQVAGNVVRKVTTPEQKLS